MDVVVLPYENVTMNFRLDSWLIRICSPYYEGEQKAQENWFNNIEKEALPIKVLLYVVYNYCIAMTVAVLVKQNLKVYFSADSHLKSSLFPHFEGETKALKIQLNDI